MNRPGQLVNGSLYLRGLLEQGSRKSLEPMVERLCSGADYQSMQQFVADSPWDPALVDPTGCRPQTVASTDSQRHCTAARPSAQATCENPAPKVPADTRS